MGLGIDYNLYTFRHTFATNLLNKTSDIHFRSGKWRSLLSIIFKTVGKVSKALGHSNIMITSKHYANRSTKDIHRSGKRHTHCTKGKINNGKKWRYFKRCNFI